MGWTMEQLKVGLDSQCLSYIIDVLVGVEEPTDPLANERKALVRAWFYRPVPWTFYVSETVVSECARIRDEDRQERHERFIDDLFENPPRYDSAAVVARATKLMEIHPKLNDCCILAEAEDLGLDTLLTYDADFRRRLAPVSRVVVTTPSAYWDGLDISRGVRPQIMPDPTNPLSRQSWWRGWAHLHSPAPREASALAQAQPAQAKAAD